MIVGGFYSVDYDLAMQDSKKEDFNLRCDLNKEYSRKFYTNNGRTATVYAFKSGLDLKKGEVILLPDYLCVSVINALEVTGCTFRFYKIKKDLTVDMKDFESKLDSDVKVIYVIHYFGIPQSAEFRTACLDGKKKYGCKIVEDLTQNLYSRDSSRIGYGDYLVSSTRKWIPSTDGGIIAIKNGIDAKDYKLGNAYDEAVYRQLFISVAREKLDADPKSRINDYLNLEKQANAARYIDFDPREMTFLSKRVLFNMDHEYSIKRRIANYNYLYDRLSKVKGIEKMAKELDKDGNFVPFGFPILVEERDKVYRYLAEHGVIGEIQWLLPLQYYTPGEEAKYLSDHNIMLQCDQRYSEKEMDYTAKLIEDYFGGKQ